MMEVERCESYAALIAIDRADREHAVRLSDKMTGPREQPGNSELKILTPTDTNPKHQTCDSLRVAWYAYTHVSALEC